MDFGIAGPADGLYPTGFVFLKTPTNAGDKDRVNSNLIAKLVLCLKVSRDFPVVTQSCLICTVLFTNWLKKKQINKQKI